MLEKLGYTPKQIEIFGDPHRFKTIAKGRRFGFTHGVSNHAIEEMNQNEIAVLWGDTVTGNIKRYVERYWMPSVKRIFSPNQYKWDKTNNIMHIGKSYCDFRSADRPENWEGYGYDLVILNEAGIILKNPYLWGNAVRPMLMDNPNSKAIIGGVPKGKNLFQDLCLYGAPDFPDWKSWTVTSYDNPMIAKKDVDDLKAELRKIGGEAFVQQEIYAQFLESSEFQYIETETITEAFNREHPRGAEEGAPKIVGVDFARKRDRNVIFHRQGIVVPDIHVFQPNGKQWSVRFARKIVNISINDWGADHIFIDEGESGGGVIDILENWGYGDMITPVMFGGEPDNKHIYLNKRVEMYADFRIWLSGRGSLPKGSIHAHDLKKDLQSLSYDHSKRTGKLKLIPKTALAVSTDISDAGALTFAGPVVVGHTTDGYRDPCETSNTSYVR